jgi:hypothetical protein
MIPIAVAALTVRRLLALPLALCLLIGLSGCAARLDRAGERFFAGEPRQALQLLEKGDSLGQRNQLLYLLEQGLVLHQLGEYRQSTEKLLAAAALIKRFEKISLSEQAGALVTTAWLKKYKGEYSERLWVHSYLMMNFLLLEDYEAALVEAKQALELLDRYPAALEQAYFTRALIGLCFANLEEHNGAYLVYRRLAADLPDPAKVAADILRPAQRLGMQDVVDKYRALLPADLPQGEAELVLFVANGRIPRKRPGNLVLPPSIRFSFPYYNQSRAPRPRLEIQPRQRILPVISSDLGHVAVAALEARKVQIIAAESIRAAGKEAIAQAVGNKNDSAAEAMVRIALFLLKEPDTRSWQTLPGRLSLIRIPLSAGEHRLRVQLVNAGKTGREQWVELPPVQLRQGQRRFLSLRF